MLDTIILDIETKNTLADVGGKENLSKLAVSVACFYSKQKDKFSCFSENQFAEMKKFLSQRALLVGFSSNKFDLPVLQHTLELDLMSYPRLDISDEIEIRTGRLVGLGDLAHYNLGTEKTAKGLDAPVLYAKGKLEELRDYCQKDVEITAKLFEKIKKKGELVIPPRSTDAVGEPELIQIDISQTLNNIS